MESVVSVDRSCAWPDGSMFMWGKYQWGVESKIILFRPLGLSLHKVPNLQTQKYSYCFSQSSLFGSCCGAWVEVWNVIFMSGCCLSLQCIAMGLFLSDKCSSILNLSGLVV